MKAVYIGTSGWSYKDWVGNFYPEKTQPQDFLEYYATVFNSVELDTTFYGIPRKSTVEKWYRSVPNGFIFTAKFPQLITHYPGLVDANETLTQFLDTMSGLKEKLGPLLMQFPYSFKPEMQAELAKFIGILPKDFNFVVEIRNRKWLNEKFYDLLREHAVGLALVDHPWMPKIGVATSKTCYIRFLGDRQKITHDFTHEHIDHENGMRQWQGIVSAIEEKIDDFYGYFNNHYSGHSPTTARRFIKIIEERFHDVSRSNLAPKPV